MKGTGEPAVGVGPGGSSTKVGGPRQDVHTPNGRGTEKPNIDTRLPDFLTFPKCSILCVCVGGEEQDNLHFDIRPG